MELILLYSETMKPCKVFSYENKNDGIEKSLQKYLSPIFFPVKMTSAYNVHQPKTTQTQTWTENQFLY